MPELVKIKEAPSFQLLCQRRWRSCAVFITLAIAPIALIFFATFFYDAFVLAHLLKQAHWSVWYVGGGLMFYFLALSALHVFVANNYHEDVNTQVEYVLKARGNQY